MISKKMDFRLWIIICLLIGFLGFLNVHASDREVGEFNESSTKALMAEDSGYGSISGKVLCEPDGVSFAGIRIVAAYYENYYRAADSTTDSDGTYTIINLPEGRYFVSVHTDTFNYVSEYYDDEQDIDSATSVTVASDEDTSGIDFFLETGGMISGTVTQKSNGDPIEKLYVVVYNYETGDFASSTLTDSDGYYLISGLPESTYRVLASPEYGYANYVLKYYDNVQDSELATPVTVIKDQTTTNIDFSLEAGGSITGTVTRESDGQPIQGVTVTAYDYDTGDWIDAESPDADGIYTIRKIPEGRYRIHVNTYGTIYLSEYYTNTSDHDSATPVNVTEGQTTTDIAFTLEAGGSVSGIVTRKSDGQPIENILVWAYNFDTDESVASDYTDSDGIYMINRLPEGRYIVYVSTSGTNYFLKIYDNTEDWESATLVTVVAEQTTMGINFVLETGGIISGKVTRESDGEPLEGIHVYAYDYDGGYASSTVTASDGTYEIKGLSDNQYRISVSTSGTNYIYEYYDNVWYYQFATPVYAAKDQITPDINFSLETGGIISGNVTRESDGQPVEDIQVEVYNYDTGNRHSFVHTNSDGTYTIMGLPAGSYRVLVMAYRTIYISEYFDNVFSSATATPVVVVQDQTTANIDFVIGTGGSVSGTVVRESDGQPIQDLRVRAYDYDTGDSISSAYTDSDGKYTISKLPEGRYRIRAYTSDTDYLSEYYDNTEDSSSATPVVVIQDQTTEGIDFSLETGGCISGTVTLEADDQPIEDIRVYAYDYDTGGIVYNDYTDSDGKYKITKLPEGRYRVWTDSTDYITKYYDNVYDSSYATPVVVVQGQTTTDIDFALDSGGSISGTVTLESDDSPLPYILIYASDYNNGTYFTQGFTDFDGTYTITGLPEGQYLVEAYSYLAFYWFEFECLDELYDNVSEINFATPVSVIKDQTTSNINFSLSTWGSISGTVTSASDGLPIGDIQITAFNSLTDTSISSQVTGSDGTYTITGLPEGQYKVIAWQRESGCNYVPEFYNDVSGYSSATAVGVLSGQVTSKIDFGLETGGVISGTVTRASDDMPLENMQVDAYDFDTGEWRSGISGTKSDGTYEIGGLPEGRYRVEAHTSGTDYVSQVYSNTLNRESASPVNVYNDQTTSKIDFTLETGGSVSGTVYEEDGLTPAKGKYTIYAYYHEPCQDLYKQLSYGRSNQITGTYTISGIPLNTDVFLCIEPGYTSPFFGIPQCIQWHATPSSTTLCSEAQSLVLDEIEALEHIDFQLETSTIDWDNDHLTDNQELILGTAPDDPDSDNDGLLDGIEVNQTGTDPLLKDTDGDLMDDGWEVDHDLKPLEDDALEDPDADMFVNVKEYLYGTHPGIDQDNPEFTIGIDYPDSDVDGKDLFLFIRHFNEQGFSQEDLNAFTGEFGRTE